MHDSKDNSEYYLVATIVRSYDDAGYNGISAYYYERLTPKESGSQCPALPQRVVAMSLTPTHVSNT